MGGLLEKATVGKSEESEAVSKDSTFVHVAETTQSNRVAISDNPQISFSQYSKLGMAIGGLAFVLMWFLGSYTLQDLTGPIPFGLVVISLFGASFYLVWSSVDRQKTVSLAVIYILMASIPYGAGFIGGGFVGITDIDFSEEGDELTFKIRGSFDSVDVKIKADGKDVWTGSAEMSNEIKNFRVPVLEFFSGNGEKYDGKDDVEYTIYAESSNGLTGEVDVPGKLLTREAQNAGVRINALQGFESNNEYLGITVNLLVGLINPNHSNVNGGGFQSVGIRPMNGDYTIDISVSGGSSQWSESTMTVDENTVTWNSQSSGTGEASTDGWFELTGTDEEDQTGTLYVAKERFYEDPGCYTFTVEIVNTVSPTETFTSTWSWMIDLESGDDEAGIDKGDGIGGTC